MKERLWNSIAALRKSAPLVHSITNDAVMNNTANALLAAGTSPFKAQARQAMEDKSYEKS